MRLLHVRQAAGAPRLARSSRSTTCSRSPAAAPRCGCHEALFTLGEAPEDRYPTRRDWLEEHGYASTVDYLVAACRRRSLDETGLLPHANAGALSETDLARLRAVSPSQGMMLETLAARLGEPGGPHQARPTRPRRAGSPRSRPPVAPASRSPPASSSASARPAPSASTRCSRSATRTRATATCRRSSSRTSCPSRAPRCGAHEPCDRRRVPLDDRRRAALVLGARRAPPGAAEPLDARRARRRSSPPGSTTGAASRRSRPTT